MAVRDIRTDLKVIWILVFYFTRLRKVARLEPPLVAGLALGSVQLAVGGSHSEQMVAATLVAVSSARQDLVCEVGAAVGHAGAHRQNVGDGHLARGEAACVPERSAYRH